MKSMELINRVHKMKAETLYKRKFQAKISMKAPHIEAVCFDFQKNLPVPNITTNDVYYRRQLSFHSFNIHVLSTQDSVFYT